MIEVTIYPTESRSTQFPEVTLDMHAVPRVGDELEIPGVEPHVEEPAIGYVRVHPVIVKRVVWGPDWVQLWV